MQYEEADYAPDHLIIVPRYNVGEKVLIRTDIEDWEKDYTPHLTADMEEYVGREVTIASNIEGKTMYKIEEDGGVWKWHHNWFEPLQIEEEEPDEMTEQLKEMDAKSAKDLGHILGW